MNPIVNVNPRQHGKVLRGVREKQRPCVSATARLRYRETNGYCKKTAVSRGSRKKFIPRRFAYPIKSLINKRYLQEGHIFLGFSSCDTFLISYTETLGEAGNSGFLSHVYTLYWWLWDPGCTAKMVGSVRLFANDEIECSLYLCYAEWPTSKAHIVVYGYSKQCDSGYITIATVPSLTPCKECEFLSASSRDHADSSSKPLCITHGYTVHFKQASGTCQTGVLTGSGLKIDDILVLNIGDSIAVLSTGNVNDLNNLDNLPLSSIKRSANEEPIPDSDLKDGVENDVPVPEDNLINPSCSQQLTSEGTNEADQCNTTVDYPLFDGTTKWDMDSFGELKSAGSKVYDMDGEESDGCERISLVRRNPNADKENVDASYRGIFETQISIEVDPYFDPEPKSIVLNGSSLKNHDTCAWKGAASIQNDCTSSRHAKQGANCKEECECQSCNNKGKCIAAPRFGPYCILNEKQNSPQNSRSELSLMTPSPTASDGSSSIQFSESGIPFSNGKVGSNVRNSDGLVSFCESFYGQINQDDINENRPIPVGETNFQFCTMSCLGACGEMLHPLEKGDSSIQAYSQNLVLDLEHVIFDILRTRCYVAYKYGYLVDYEANILDVSSSTRSVVIHIAAVLNIRHARTKLLHTVAQRACSQQAEFILCWSLSSGRYEVVVARPLVPYDERKMGEWKGTYIVTADTAIKRHCSIPGDPHKSVYVLDNSAVLRGRSLNVIWNCDKTLAITK